MFDCYFLEASSFLRERKEDTQKRRGKEKLGGIEGGETVSRIYCLKRESIFNQREGEKERKVLSNLAEELEGV